MNQIGYLGPEETFGHQAAKIWSPNAIHAPFLSHLHVLDAVENGKVKKGIVAIENSTDGTVNAVIDYFIHDATNVRVCGEVVVPINQCLFARPGTMLDDVRIVISHPTGLGQCAKNIGQYFPNAQLVEAFSTAAAVSQILAMDVPAVAIAGQMAIQPGTVILRENFQDAENNTTRFWVVGRSNAQPTGQDKTSICVIPMGKDKPGTLYWILGEFARLEINLKKIESRPTKRVLGEYVFLIDLDGHQEDPKVQEALGGVRRQVETLKVFGSYPQRTDGN